MLRGQQVQQEDVRLCEAVQRGLASPAFHSGRCDQPPELVQAQGSLGVYKQG